MKEKIAQNMEQIPLCEALVCINCNTISRRPKRFCPRCAGEQLMALAVWLGSPGMKLQAMAAPRRAEGGNNGAQV